MMTVLTKKILTYCLMSLLFISKVFADVEPIWLPQLTGLKAIDIKGIQHKLEDVIGEQHLVLIIMATDCPISRRMTPRLKELARIAEQNNMAYYGVFSDDWSTREEILTYQKEYEVDFSLLLDSGATIVKQLRSGVKPEAFVFSKEGKMVYRGRIDNRFVSIGKLRNTFDQHDLLNAMLAVKDNKMPVVQKTQAIGCVYNSWDD